jgi:hypothetical protein
MLDPRGRTSSSRRQKQVIPFVHSQSSIPKDPNVASLQDQPQGMQVTENALQSLHNLLVQTMLSNSLA